MKLPKRYSGIAKTAVDPLGLGVGDALFGKSKGPDYSKEEAAQAAALGKGQKATDDFVKGGAAHYDTGNKLDFSALGPADRLSDTGMNQISTDPRYKDAEMGALKDLEDQSKNGFTAQDRADMAKVEMNQNRASRGRIGAIQQNMQARGMSGSGMDLVSQMQSAQDADQIEAMKALEQEGMMQSRKQDATSRLGSLSSQLQGQDFNQAAQKAQAQDAINRFNTQNSNDVMRYNNAGQNQTTGQNWNRENQTSDRNSGADYDFRKDALGANQAQAGMDYNSSVDGENRKRLQDKQNQEAAAGKMGAVMGAGGAIIGGVYGGPAGATAGAQVGSGLGKTVGGNAYRNTAYAHGGKIPGKAPFPGDDPRNDIETVDVSPEEIVLPRSVSHNPAAAAAFVAKENGKDHKDDAIGHLLKAISSLHKRT